MKVFEWFTFGFALCSVSPLPAAGELSFHKSAEAIVLKDGQGREVLRYQLAVPKGSTLSVSTACYFHPLSTPKGIVMTEVAPADHRHHRGIFLGWVEMHGEKDADFWGWGEHAPVKGRTIVNRTIDELKSNGPWLATFKAVNDWLADDQSVVRERLRAQLRLVAPTKAIDEPAPSGYLLDLHYTLEPQIDLTLAQWAFSGFCVRTRKDGTLEAWGPEGKIGWPNPSHVKPQSDWPAAPWYGYTLALEGGQNVGVAVLNSPHNPPSLWHNHRDIRMLNPCIVAPGPVQLKRGQPLVLHYRVLASDGAIPTELLNQLATDW